MNTCFYECLILCTDVVNSSEKLAGGLNVIGGNGELPASYLNSRLSSLEFCDGFKSINHLPTKCRQLR